MTFGQFLYLFVCPLTFMPSIVFFIIHQEEREKGNNIWAATYLILTFVMGAIAIALVERVF